MTTGGVIAIAAVIAIVAFVMARDRAVHDSRVGTAGTSSGALIAEGIHARHIDPRTLDRASIAGTITDDHHAPIAHARVCAVADSADISTELTREPRCADSDDAGRYALPVWLAADYAVTAMAWLVLPDRFHPDGDRRRTSFPLAAGEHRAGVDLVLHAGGVEITGTVADVSGGPIAHARVHAQLADSNTQLPVIEADDAGKFSIWTRPGSLEVIATADGYARGTQSGRAPGTFALLLVPESTFAGTVVDAKTNEPIAGVAVEVEGGDGGSWASPNTIEHRDITDEHGAFRATRLSPGRYTATARSAHGFGRSAGSTQVGLAQHVDGVVIKLHAAVQVQGKIVVAGKTDPHKRGCTDGSIDLHDEKHDRDLSARIEPDGRAIVMASCLATTWFALRAKGTSHTRSIRTWSSRTRMSAGSSGRSSRARRSAARSSPIRVNR